MQQNTSPRHAPKQDAEDRLSTPLLIVFIVVIAICFVALLQLLIRGSDGLYLQ